MAIVKEEFMNSHELMEQIKRKEESDAKMEKGFLGEDDYIEIQEEMERMNEKDAENAINPSHYEFCGIKTEHIIKLILNHFNEQLTPWQAFCMGSALKYRLRAEKKPYLDQVKALEDLDKAMKFEMELFHL